ncbi:hypothetical protein ACFQ51_48195 [Streptomyces kaempferi]
MWETLARDPRVPQRTVGQPVPPQRPSFRPPALGTGCEPMPKPEQAPRPVGPAAAMNRQYAPGPPVPRTGAAPHVMAVTVGAPDPSLRMSQPHLALPAVTGAAEADPLRAALDAVYVAVATYGEDYPALLEEIRSVSAAGA